jgi:hypothetical protein
MAPGNDSFSRCRLACRAARRRTSSLDPWRPGGGTRGWPPSAPTPPLIVPGEAGGEVQSVHHLLHPVPRRDPQHSLALRRDRESQHQDQKAPPTHVSERSTSPLAASTCRPARRRDRVKVFDRTSRNTRSRWTASTQANVRTRTSAGRAERGRERRGFLPICASAWHGFARPIPWYDYCNRDERGSRGCYAASGAGRPL